ncbi:unnamed protein product [Ambrosiozyma monospora]|uniref:Unnamed protein product n=1 Tax=Ambrosiozyma monospora TaxID=43982 RepID=A0ACB5U1U1_AMBMO|nr:unnamed protein product [Ambrosiozyma monospora]
MKFSTAYTYVFIALLSASVQAAPIAEPDLLDSIIEVAQAFNGNNNAAATVTSPAATAKQYAAATIADSAVSGSESLTAVASDVSDASASGSITTLSSSHKSSSSGSTSVSLITASSDAANVNVVGPSAPMFMGGVLAMGAMLLL